MKKVIVTGANGFIGSAVCKELSKNGVDIIAIVRGQEEKIDSISNINGIKIIYCDISNFKNLADLILDKDIDVFYHFAWVGTSGQLRGNVDVQIKNIEYTCDALKACFDLGCKRFVFASSIMEYEIESIMAMESTPNVNTLYCTAKKAADYMARALAGSYGIDYFRAIISNVYGPGEYSPRLINSSLRKLMNNEHCSFSSGNQIYDFIYITDAAKAFIAIGKKGIKDKTYYIGSQNPRQLKDFLLEMKNCVNPDIKIGLGELPYNGVSLTYKEFDINAVELDTGFVPEVSFSEGIKKTIEWIKEENV